MNLSVLNEKMKSCHCGKPHSCPIDDIKIGAGAIHALPQLCEKYHHILLVGDNNTYLACGKDLCLLLEGKIDNQVILESNGNIVIPDEEAIAQIEQTMDEKTDFIIGVGSGVINDLCKHVAFSHNLNYGIVATAPSMDGYASSGAALILKGMKTTLDARPPKIIVGDTDILKNAPMQMIQSGYGDIIGKYSCLTDWKLSALINGEYFCDSIYNLTLSQVERVKKHREKILEKDAEAIQALMEALIYVGIAMSYVGNSRPASGSEHHLSHFFEITGILEKKEYYPHGIDVMYSSAVTAQIREKMINSYPDPYCFNREKWLDDIKTIYSTSADEVIALQDKLGLYDVDERETIIENWDEIKGILKEAPSFSQCVTMISEIGLSYDEFIAFYGLQKINDAILYAKDLKDRYTVLWLYYKYFKGNDEIATNKTDCSRP